MRLSGRPLSAAPPPPPKGEGEETRRGSRGGSPGPRSRGGAGGRPGQRRREAAGRPLPSPARRLRASRPPRADPGTWLEFSAIKVHLVWGASPAPRSSGESRRLGVAAGLRPFPGSPPALRARRKPRARSGVSARGRESRPGGPRRRLVPSPLPSPCRRRREEGAVGRPGGGSGGEPRAGPPGVWRPPGRAGVAATRGGTSRARPLAPGRAAERRCYRWWHTRGLQEGS